jgi:CcmD family protein
MLNDILQQAPAETTRYMVAGYTVIFSVMLLYLVSLGMRRRRLERDLSTLSEIELKENDPLPTNN